VTIVKTAIVVKAVSASTVVPESFAKIAKRIRVTAGANMPRALATADERHGYTWI
jgi:hypothetical protein